MVVRHFSAPSWKRSVLFSSTSQTSHFFHFYFFQSTGGKSTIMCNTLAKRLFLRWKLIVFEVSAVVDHALYISVQLLHLHADHIAVIFDFSAVKKPK